MEKKLTQESCVQTVVFRHGRRAALGNRRVPWQRPDTTEGRRAGSDLVPSEHRP